jgi:hypothetical protein
MDFLKGESEWEDFNDEAPRFELCRERIEW